jgi:glycosyltransferase involved in cell wall biosynthesis
MSLPPAITLPPLSKAPLVGVVTRTKDRVVLLRRAVESVLHQSYRNWIMVIVNDGGSPREVDDLVEAYAAEAGGRIRVVHNSKSLGMEGASKVGIDAIECDLLAIHDDDDTWAPEFLSVAIDELQRLQRGFPGVQGVATYSHRVLETIRGNLVETEAVEPFNDWVPPGLLSLDRMLAGNFIPPISFLFSKKAYEDLGSVYEIIPYLGDWAFLIRFLCRYDVYLVPQFLAFYHWRIRSSSGGFSNSVTSELDRHRFYKQFLLNAWLREDFAAGKAGVGTYANLRVQIQTLVEKANAPADEERAEVGSPSLPQAIVDYYWESASWRALRPFRTAVNRMFNLPAERKPVVNTMGEAWKAARELQESMSWNMTAPLRIFGRFF